MNHSLRDPSAYKCTGLFHSNSIFSPVLGNTFNLHELHGLEQCHSTLLGAEEARGKIAYQRVLHTRLEYAWLAAHPPLKLLDAKHAWIPSGEDYGGGLNDRHAVLSRRDATIYFSRWRLIISGEILNVDPQLRSGAVHNAYAAQGDFLIRTTLSYHNISVRRFASVAALRCCAGPCFSKACYRRALPSMRGMQSLILERPTASDLEGRADQVARSAFGASEGGADGLVTTKTFGVVQRGLARLVQGKYRDEVEAAVQHSMALKIPGGRFALRPIAVARAEHQSDGSSKPFELRVVVPTDVADAFHNATLALRISERLAMGHSGLVGVGRRRKVVRDSNFLEWTTATS